MSQISGYYMHQRMNGKLRKPPGIRPDYGINLRPFLDARIYKNYAYGPSGTCDHNPLYPRYLLLRLSSLFCILFPDMRQTKATACPFPKGLTL